MYIRSILILSICSLLGCISTPPGTASPEDAGAPDDVSDVRPADDGAVTTDVQNGPDIHDVPDAEDLSDAQDVPDAQTADASGPDMGACAALPSPYLRWSFDTLVRGTFPSEGAENLPITADGAVVTQAGKIGGAMEKTVAQFPWMAHDPILEIPEGTITFWFKAKNIVTYPNGLLSKDALGWSVGHLNIKLGQAATDSQAELTARVQHSTDTNGADDTHLNTGAVISANRWYFVALRWSNTAVTLFLDGKEVDTHPVYFSFASNKEPVGLGYLTSVSDQGSHTPSSNPGDPLLDELTFWDQPLTAQQLSILFDALCALTP